MTLQLSNTNNSVLIFCENSDSFDYIHLFIENKEIALAEIEISLEATNIDTPFYYTEDTPKKLNQISVTSDSEVLIRLSFDAEAGILSTPANVTSQFGVFELSGAVEDVNAILENLFYIPSEDFNGNFSIEVNIQND